ncbi:MAG: ATP-binding protein [Thermodesulfovibrionales bacterium]|nr:ATP-binding protein [Thermodesulfovibrionales bacterium]
MIYEHIIIFILLILIIYLLYHYYKFSLFVVEIKRFIEDASEGNLNARLFLKTHSRHLDEIVKEVNSFLEKIKTKLETADEETRRMEAILRGMTDSVLIVDTSGKIVLANRTFRKIFNVDKNIEKKQFIEVIRNRQLIDIFRRATDTWEIISDEITVSRADSDIYLIATAVPIYSDDNITGIVLTLHDITRLKQLEQIRTDFVANVSHEIKTPLTAIVGFSETLLEGAIDDRDNAIKFLQMIKNHGTRLNSLVDDLLTLSRIELGDVKVEKALIDPVEVVDTVISTFKESAEKKGLYLRKNVPNENITLFADKNRFVQILLNLVDNAIKFTERGGVTIGIKKTNNNYIVYVDDTGIGIPASHLSRLGERFYRVDRARSRELGGTGLGLAIVKHLVKAHGWDMKIESIQEVGTKVNILVK